MAWNNRFMVGLRGLPRLRSNRELRKMVSPN